LGEHWTITPTVMGQRLKTNGFFGYDPDMGDLEVAHFAPENSDDSFAQTALTIEGKINDFDLTYAGAFMKRTTHSIADYSDYSEFYDRVNGSGAYWLGNDGKPIDPQQIVVTKGYFQKWSQELRLTTPQDQPVHATVGAFWQRQQHRIWEQYVMPGYGFTNPYGSLNSPTPNPHGFSDYYSIPTLANTIWLTDETRVDHDGALFGQVSWDATSQLQFNGGLRYFTYDNTLEGFYGYSSNYSPTGSGMSQCFAAATTEAAPCTDLDKRVTGSGFVPRYNVTYKFTPDFLVYATYSKGFRPGGVNRTAEKDIGPYQADYLKNYEIGWKTEWFDHRLRYNGAFFWEDWDNELLWAATNHLTLSGGFTLLDAKLTQNYCGQQGVTNCPDLVTPQAFQPNLIGPQAPAGTNLPISPRFKGNVIARYSFDPVIGEVRPFVQLSTMYQNQTSQALRLDQAHALGNTPAYALTDVVGGALWKQTTVQLVVSNVADRRAQLTRFVATVPQYDSERYIIPAQPRTFWIKLGQKF